MKKYIFVLVLLVGLVSCEKPIINEEGTPPPKGPLFLNSYVRTFVIPKNIVFNEYQYSENEMDEHIKGFRKILIRATTGEKYSFYSTGDKKRIYDGLCQKYGDTLFNRFVDDWECPYLSSYMLYKNSVYFGNLGVDIVGIHIYSKNDFNEQHLAYQDLTDIVYFTTNSTYKFINSSYQLEKSEEDFRGNTYYYPWHWFSKKVLMLEPDDLKCLGTGFVGSNTAQSMTIASLMFPEPTLEKTHNIKIIITLDDGRVFSDTVQVRWE